MRHFDEWNQGSKEPPLEFFPQGQWPVKDHRGNRAHFPQQAAETQPAAFKPGRRRIGVEAAGYASDSRKGMVEPVHHADKGNFPYAEMLHSEKFNKNSRAYDDFPLDRKIRAPHAGRKGECYEVEKQFGRHRRVNELDKRRNGVGLAKPGDKSYDEVERSDDWWKYGSTVSTEQFDKIAGGGAGQKEVLGGRPRRRLDKERSDRSDSFGRHTISLRSKAPPASLHRDKGRPFAEVKAERKRLNDVEAVASLPDEVVWGAKEVERQAAEEAADHAAAELEATAKAAQSRNKSRRGK